MNRQLKKPRAVRPDDFLPDWYKAQESMQLWREAAVKRALELSNEPAKFFKQVVGFEPTQYQIDAEQKSQ